MFKGDPVETLGALFLTAADVTDELVGQLREAAGERLNRLESDLLGWLFKATAGKNLSGSLLSAYRGDRTDEFGMDSRVAEALRPIFEFFYQAYFRVDVTGMRSIPSKGGALIVANHSGAIPIDGVMIQLAVYKHHPQKRFARFLVDDFVPEMPFFGTLMERCGAIRATHENAMRLLKAGHVVTVFPEGLAGLAKTYEERYQLRRFGRGGFVRLALLTGVPIIPMAVVGAEETSPVLWKSEHLGKKLGVPYVPFTPTFPWLGPLGLVPLPSKWKIVAGKAIDLSAYGPEAAEDTDLVLRLAEDIREEIQTMLNKMLAQRKSIWL
jgi:1-acyl-sn-glycerol-3-phosphate acyltransferase